MEERRRGGSSLSQKRKHTGDGEEGDDEEHNVQRVVKRLIRQAQLEADSSPSGSSTGAFVSPSADHHPSPLGRTVPTPEKPVFGAYPMPSQGQIPQQPQAEGDNAANNQMFQGQNYYNNLNQFSIDPSAQNTFSNLNQQPASYQSGSQLDPAVESMLASYFPQTTTDPSTLGPAGQVPDDFLSRVFSFSWDTSQNAQSQNQSQSQNALQGTPGSAASTQPTPQSVAPNGQNQPRRQDSNAGMPGYGAFDWQSTQWMA